MMKKLSFVLAAALFVMAMAGVATAIAAEFGTAAEAKALEMFTKGEGGFKDRDLYPFCGGPDGNFTAHPKLVGKSLKDLKDKADKALGAEMYKVAKEGKISEVSYMWPRTAGTDPVQKVSFVTKAGDQVCAVGYYK
jgi:signal transduction histidine kinase